jgi:hypothetical protein
MRPETRLALAASRGRLGVIVLITMFFFLTLVRFTVFSDHTRNPDATVNLPLPDLAERLRSEPLHESHEFFRTSKFLAAESCNIEHIDGTSFDKIKTINQGQTVALEGWLVDLSKRNVADSSWIELVESNSQLDYAEPIRFRVRRSDVQDYLHSQTDFAMAGFISEFETSNLTQGDYHLLIVYKSGGNFYRCDNGRHVLIQKADTISHTTIP